MLSTPLNKNNAICSEENPLGVLEPNKIVNQEFLDKLHELFNPFRDFVSNYEGIQVLNCNGIGEKIGLLIDIDKVKLKSDESANSNHLSTRHKANPNTFTESSANCTNESKKKYNFWGRYADIHNYLSLRVSIKDDPLDLKELEKMFLEISDKKYTLEDMEKCFEAGRERIPHPDFDFVHEGFANYAITLTQK